MMEEKHTMAAFSKLDFYQEVNRRLVQMAADLGLGTQILDIGAGTGVITRLIVQIVAKAPGVTIFAVEPSQSAIDEAQKQLGQSGCLGPVEFIKSRAEEMVESVKWRLSNPADSAFFCNAIHMVRDKEEALRNIRELLHPGSILAINSSFFEGCQPPETDSFYRKWVGTCLRRLREMGVQRSRENRVAARTQLTPQDYGTLLRNNGFDSIDLSIETMKIPLEGWVAISDYAPFAEGALPGTPLETAVAVLQESVAPTLEILGIDTVPRRWLQMTAVAV